MTIEDTRMMYLWTNYSLLRYMTDGKGDGAVLQISRNTNATYLARLW